MTLPPFHLAFPVDDLAAARRFYGELLGCPEGRSADCWIDFDLFGHQIVAHLAPERVRAARRPTPSMARTCRCRTSASCLPMEQWNDACRAARQRRSVEFVIEPTVRFAGQPGEQATMFLLDPAGNALEFKAMADPAKLFAKT